VAPVANSSTVSEVEVSLSTVTQLKDRSTPFARIACSAPAGTFASVARKQQHRRHVGAIIRCPWRCRRR
jgi:hypothetical protein